MPWGASTVPALPTEPAAADPGPDAEPALYAAATMTGNQRNTATPSDALPNFNFFLAFPGPGPVKFGFAGPEYVAGVEERWQE